MMVHDTKTIELLLRVLPLSAFFQNMAITVFSQWPRSTFKILNLMAQEQPIPDKFVCVRLITIYSKSHSFPIEICCQPKPAYSRHRNGFQLLWLFLQIEKFSSFRLKPSGIWKRFRLKKISVPVSPRNGLVSIVI